MGTWKTTCVANRFYKWDDKGDLISTPSRQPEYFIVYRHQYVNLSSPDLHRVIIRTGTSPEKMMNTVFVQYYFEDEEHAVLVQPNGSRNHDNKPYKRTQETVKNTIRELNMNKRPKDVFHTILKRTGGIENLTSGSQKPRDMQQVYNLKRKESNDEILETIDLRATEEIKFIRHIEMVPEFSVFLATDNQLHEIEKYCTNNANFSILGVDTTFNIGNFYVTLTFYRNLMLEHKTKKHEPVMIGPVLIHQQRTYDSFYMLPSFMIRTKPTLNKILVYGTDEELNLKTSFSSCLPFAHHLLCDIHMKDNIISKLTSLNIKGAVRQLYVDEIFGNRYKKF
ncbi:unnamed protein product [Mytilus coruscus]|uniref:MULE transposase domain-containing protein n=1 Tax=Mytilus coruscus TaxID=42192 RepID=A0A6J8AMT9_MYTCO|nr:unnamed protein product [Mytilus coruscus]